MDENVKHRLDSLQLECNKGRDGSKLTKSDIINLLLPKKIDKHSATKILSGLN